VAISLAGAGVLTALGVCLVKKVFTKSHHVHTPKPKNTTNKKGKGKT
jgi:hypothetical protein